MVRYIAEILGYELDDIDSRLGKATLKVSTDLNNNVGVLAAGTICAHRWQLAGKVDGKAVVSVQYFATVSSTPWCRTPGHVRLQVLRPALFGLSSGWSPQHAHAAVVRCHAQDREKNLNSAIALTGMAVVQRHSVPRRGQAPR